VELLIVDFRKPVVIDGFKKWTFGDILKSIDGSEYSGSNDIFCIRIKFSSSFLNSLKNIEGLYGGCSGHCFSLSSMAAVTEI
jgi:hypothetical protein